MNVNHHKPSDSQDAHVLLHFIGGAEHEHFHDVYMHFFSNYIVRYPLYIALYILIHIL